MLVDTMYSKLAMAGVALGSSIALFWFWTTSRGLELTFYTALVAVLVALYWGVEYALLTGKLIISKGHIDIDWNAFHKGNKAESANTEAVEPDARSVDAVEPEPPVADAVSE